MYIKLKVMLQLLKRLSDFYDIMHEKMLLVSVRGCSSQCLLFQGTFVVFSIETADLFNHVSPSIFLYFVGTYNGFAMCIKLNSKKHLQWISCKEYCRVIHPFYFLLMWDPQNGQANDSMLSFCSLVHLMAGQLSREYIILIAQV